MAKSGKKSSSTTARSTGSKGYDRPQKSATATSPPGPDHTLLSAELLAAFARRYRLPTREIEALRFLLEGHTHKKMVKLMGCKFATVKSHCARLYAKLGVHNHLGLVYKVLSFRSSSPALNERERKRRSKRAAKVYGRMPAKVAQQNWRS